MGFDQDDGGRVPLADNGLRSWSLPAAVIVLGLLAQSGGQPARVLLRYGRSAIADGEWWRLLTGHFVHLGWPHFLMNAIALVLIWALVGRYLRWLQWLAVLLIVVVGIDAGFWWREPGLYWYVGLSGVLHGLLCAGIVAAVPRVPAEMLVLAVLVAAKLVYEQLAGALPGSAATAGGPVVVNAHLYGAIAGTLCGGFFLCNTIRRVPV